MQLYDLPVKHNTHILRFLPVKHNTHIFIFAFFFILQLIVESYGRKGGREVRAAPAEKKDGPRASGFLTHITGIAGVLTRAGSSSPDGKDHHGRRGSVELRPGDKLAKAMGGSAPALASAIISSSSGSNAQQNDDADLVSLSADKGRQLELESRVDQMYAEESISSIIDQELGDADSADDGGVHTATITTATTATNATTAAASPYSTSSPIGTAIQTPPSSASASSPYAHSSAPSSPLAQPSSSPVIPPLRTQLSQQWAAAPTSASSPVPVRRQVSVIGHRTRLRFLLLLCLLPFAFIFPSGKKRGAFRSSCSLNCHFYNNPPLLLYKIGEPSPRPNESSPSSGSGRAEGGGRIERSPQQHDTSAPTLAVTKHPQNRGHSFYTLLCRSHEKATTHFYPFKWWFVRMSKGKSSVLKST